MLDAARSALARREALKHIRRRPVRPWAADPAQRRVLVVLPAGQEETKEAWRFVKALGVPHRQITPVVPGDTVVTYVPVEFIGRVHRMEPKHLGLLGLPKGEFAEAVWRDAPDVALCLTPEPDAASAYLVGASPAALRIGLHEQLGEAFYDLVVTGGASFEATLLSLREALQRIEPPVFPFAPDAGGAADGRPA